MKEHPNFYENLKEANMRLRGTVVLYDGAPYHLFAICDHKKDGIFRAYLDPLPQKPRKTLLYGDFPQDHPGLGQYIDEWMEKNPDAGILRKHLNSPAFDRFRPFPLGMCNSGRNTYYVERLPNRRTEQGLTRNMLSMSLISTSNESGDIPRSMGPELMSEAMTACIRGEYPSAQDTIRNLRDPDVQNHTVGFHRMFAFVRGPIGMLFLAYKSDVIGVLPNNDLSRVRVGRSFKHTLEVVSDLGIFDNIEVG